MRSTLLTYTGFSSRTAIAAAALAACALACTLALGAFGWAFADENDASEAAVEITAEAEEELVAENEEAGSAAEEVADEAAENVEETEETEEAAGGQRSATSADDAEGNIVDPTQRADNSFIYDTTLESLFEEASLYDNRIVQIEGEVIGDCIVVSDDPTHCWVTLTSVETENKSTISVLMSRELAAQIDSYGRYGVTGTILQVRGEYHQACKDHDGLADIHATEATVITRGVVHKDEFNINDFLPGLLAIAIGLALMGLFHFARERTR